MGADYYPITVIGIRVPRSKIMDEKEVFNNHCICVPQTDPTKYPNAKFCPFCGRSLKRAFVKFTPKLSGVKEYDNESKLLGRPVSNDTDAENFFVGVYSSGMVDYQKREDIPDLSKKILAKFRKDMKSIGL